MNRCLTAMLATLLLMQAATAAQAPDHPWLRASAYLDRDALPRGGEFRVAVVLDLDRGFHVNANPPTLDFLIRTVVTPEPGPAVAWGDVRYPKGEPLAAAWADGKSIQVYGGRAVIVVSGRTAPDAALGPVTLRLALSYQGCDADTCYQPASRPLEVSARVVEAGAAARPVNAAVFAEADRPPGPAPGGSAAAPEIRFEGETDVGAWYARGLGVLLVLAFVYGLGLNLTPCVFPIIPVTMSLFAQQGEKRPLKVLPLAAVYVLGLAATFTVVGVLAALAGRSLGLVLQSPWGVLGIVTVLAAMMASSFGAFEIQLPSGAMGRLGGRRGLLGAAFTGMVMGAVAAPCVGPFLIGLIAFVAARGSVLLGAAAFFATGLGLGSPYLFLGTFTSLINRFPHGGGWLIWTKRVLGMGLAGLILYFLDPYLAPALRRPMMLGLFVFAAVFLGVLEGRSRRPFTRRFWMVRLALAALLLVTGVALYAATAPADVAAPEGPAAEPAGPHLEWTPWQDGALEASLAEGRPVLLYFGASWCTECRVWKARLFADPAVIRAAAPLTRLSVDVSEAPQGRKLEFSERYRGTNPPAVIILACDGRLVKAYRDPPDAAAFIAALVQAAESPAPTGPGPRP